MSYAIILSATDESGTVLSADEQTQARGVETFSRIESRVRQLLGDTASAGTPPNPGGTSFGEVTSTDTGLQVVLTGEGAQVRFPTDGRADPGALHEQARQVVRIVQEETGWDAYDPQTQQNFDGHFHTAARPLIASTGLPTGAPSEPPAGLLKNLKRRAITSFVLAAVILGFAVWDVAIGSVGWFTWVLVVIGVVNLLAGLVVTVRTKGFTDAESFRG